MFDPKPIQYENHFTFVPLVDEKLLQPITFDMEVKKFINSRDPRQIWEEPFLNTVAAPMIWAFELHKNRQYTRAIKTIEDVKQDDWRIAGTNWIRKRREMYARKTTAGIG